MTTQHDWQPIETAPTRADRVTFVVASFPKGFVGLSRNGRIDRDCFTNIRGEYFAPTHWTPLPPPPSTTPQD